MLAGLVKLMMEYLYLRLRRSMRPRVAYTSADAFYRPESPLVLASSIASVALSIAAEIGGRVGLLGHLGCLLLSRA